MKKPKHELSVPPEVLLNPDPDAFELMRLWASHGQLHVALSSELGGGAEDFGELLADLYEHAARMYSQRDNVPIEHCRQIILRDFIRRARAPKESLEGGIPPADH